MTARPASTPRAERRLKVIKGGRVLRPTLGTWMVFTAVAIALFFALIMSRVALDKPALELSDLTDQIAAGQAHFQQLRLEVARLQSPERIVSRAQDLGLVYPEDVKVLIADGVGDETPAEGDRFADVKSIYTASP
jgi:cell division protein FtsL